MRQRKNPSNAGKSWGPFTSRQLTTIVCVVIVAAVAIPTAAMAAVGTFTSTTATPAVTGTNSSTAANAKGVQGTATAGGASTVYGVSGTANASTNGVGVFGSGKKWGVLGVSAGTATNAAGIWGNATAASAADHFGVWGNANGTGGIGVNGIGAKYGVFSNGPLGIASGKSLSCVTTCVPGSLLAAGSVSAGKLGASSVSASNLDASAQAIQPLASGQSESGMYGVGGDNTGTAGLIMVALNYARPLGTAIAPANIIDTGAGANANCPGVGSAAPGYLCLYPNNWNNVTPFGSLGSETFGASFAWTQTAAVPLVNGVYTVTAA